MQKDLLSESIYGLMGRGPCPHQGRRGLVVYEINSLCDCLYCPPRQNTPCVHTWKCGLTFLQSWAKLQTFNVLWVSKGIAIRPVFLNYSQGLKKERREGKMLWQSETGFKLVLIYVLFLTSENNLTLCQVYHIKNGAYGRVPDIKQFWLKLKTKLFLYILLLN